MPATEINRLAPTARERTITVAADGQPIPIAYGRINLPGLLFAQGTISTDLVLGYALCIGEIDAIEMVQINDVDATTIAGVTVTTYLGTAAQTANATLSSAIAGYNDSMRFDVGNGLRGIAYVVLRITTAAAVGGWPRLRATIRGRKVYDPRTGLTAYSDNTALCMADLVTDMDYGLGLAAANLTAAANWCDSLLADGTTKRSRLSLALDNPAPIESWLDLLSVYAECFYSYSGATVKLVPDQAVDLNAVPTITNWQAESLSIRHEDSADSPGAVEMVYTVPRTDALPWATKPVKRELVGSSRSPTTVRMPGVYQLAEADNKALARLNRTKSRVTASFSVMDAGVAYEVGDVVKLTSVARGISSLPVRIRSIDMQGPGRYQVTGEKYDASHYPSELPPVTGAQIPAGGIIPWSGGAIPANFTELTAAHGRLIVGAGGTYAQSATGGTGWSATFSGTTTTNGAHNVNTAVYDRLYVPGGVSELGIQSSGGPTGNPAHSHSYTSSAVTVNPKRRQQRLIKATTAQATIPVGGRLFGLAGITGGGWTRDVANAGRVIESASADANVGADSQTSTLTTGSTSDAHTHTAAHALGAQADFASQDLFYSDSAGGAHTHTATLNIIAALKRRRLALYTNSTDAALLPGHIIAWEGGSVPANWVLCNGANGTPDCRDYFVEIAASGNENTAAGDNTVTATATTSSVGHSHVGGDLNDNRTAIAGGHSDTVYHNHSISSTVALSPTYYALAFIMYSPGS